MSTAGPDDRIGRGALAGIFLTALAVAGVHLWQVSRSPFLGILLGDAEGYDGWARQIAAGQWLGTEVFYQAPLYPYCLAVVYAVTGANYQLIFVLQVVLHAASCLLLAVAATRFFSRRAGIVAGLMLALYAPAIFPVGLIEKSTLDVFLVCLALFLLSWALHRGNRGGWFWLGAMLGALTLTRENAIVFLAALAVWLIAGRRRLAQPWPVLGGLLLAGFLLVVLPVALRNFLVGGRWYLTTSQLGTNFYIGNHEQATGVYQSLRPDRGHVRFERRDATELAQQALGRLLSPAEVSSYWTQKALAYIGSQPGHWLALLAKKTALAFNAVEAMDTVAQSAWTRWSWPLRLLAYGWHFGWLAVLAAVGVWCTRHEGARLAPLYLMSGAYILSVIAFYVTARYRLPVVPFLMVLAAAGVTRLRDCWRGSSQTGKVVLVATMVAFAVLAHWPLLNAAQMTAWTYGNYGKALADQKRFDEAVPLFQEAVRINPADADAQYHLGIALAGQGNLAEAIQHYERAIQLQPDNAEAHNNLGNALDVQGDAVGAIKHYQRAIQLRPEYAEPYYNLGTTLAGQGKLPEAVRQYERALQLQPDNAAAHHNLGYVLAQQGKLAEAIQHYEQALQLKPDHALARCNLAITLRRQGKLAEANQQFQQALSLATAQGHAALVKIIREQLNLPATAQPQLPKP